ncbi:MAG TPA: thioesterase domain-containing protein [Candidatus Eisenbacteria bacterium]|nr:thioesterase domain-containing protein [Candidatus Eisenbacteria bacterium]
MSGEWLQTSPAAHPRARVVCTTRAGGSARDFDGWSPVLGDDVEVCAVQLPGRLDRFREPALDSIEPIAVAVAEAIAGLPDALPLVLVGDCMGALVAYEVARVQRRRGWTMAGDLVVASYLPPDRLRTEQPYHDAPAERLRGRLAEVGGVPAHVLMDDELFELLLPTLRADFSVFERYRYTGEPPLEAAIHAIVGEADPHLGVADMEGWGCHTSRTFTVRTFPGGHFFLREHEEPLRFVRDVALAAP